MREKAGVAGRCPEFDRYSAEAPGDEVRRAAWEEHLQSCASCKAQELADRALRAVLGSLPRPRLPPSFAQGCASRAVRNRRGGGGTS